MPSARGRGIFGMSTGVPLEPTSSCCGRSTAGDEGRNIATLNTRERHPHCTPRTKSRISALTAAAGSVSLPDADVARAAVEALPAAKRAQLL
jgi:hypothetical protein